VIAVFGSGTTAAPNARAAGRAIASRGHDLLTGGGGGCMQAALEGFLEVGDRTGQSHAILPRHQYQPSGYDQVVRTCFDAPKDMGATPYSRNLVNVAFCHGCIFVSDTLGTLTEVVWMHRLGKPAAFFGPAATWLRAEALLREKQACHDVVVATPTTNLQPEAMALLDRLIRRVTPKK